MNTPSLCLLVLAGLLSVANLADAQIYKWVDAEGRVHYSNTRRPPPQPEPGQQADTPGHPPEPSPPQARQAPEDRATQVPQQPATPQLRRRGEPGPQPPLGKADLNVLLEQTQKKFQSADEFTLVWWIPEELWQVMFATDPQGITAAEFETFAKDLRLHLLIVVLDGKSEASGGITFKSESAIRSRIQLKDRAGNLYRPLTPAESDAKANQLLSSLLGSQFQFVHFFFFPSKNAKGQPIADPTKPGAFSVKLGDREFSWTLPLRSLPPQPASVKAYPTTEQQWRIETATKAPPQLLAHAYLVVSSILELAELARAGAEVNHRIDGKWETMNKSNVETYVARFTERLNIYSNAIRQRGFQQLTGEYNTTLTPGCNQVAVGLSQGKAVIDQDGFNITLIQSPVKHTGVVVESALAVESGVDSDIHLLGEMKQGRIELRHPPSKCVVTLTVTRVTGK